MKSPQDKPATPISRLEKDFFQAAFDLSAVAMAVINQAGVFLRVNAAFSEFVGEGSPELLGRRWSDVLHPDDVTASAAACDRVLRGEASSLRLEQRYLHQDGRVRWGDVNASLVGEGRGGPPHFFAQILDVTERRQLADAERTTQYYQRALLDNFPFLVWLKDADNRLLAVNQAYADICGAASPEELLGKTDLDLWPEDLAQRYRADDQEVLRTRQKKSGEEPIEDRRGVRKWFEVYKAPVEDDQGKLYGTVGFSRDITHRKQAEQQLALIDFALNQVREAAFLIDESACFQYVNDEACRSLGYSRDELLRMGVADLDPEWPTDRWSENWGHFKAHQSHTVETHHTAKDGRVFPVEVTASYFEYDGHAYKLSLVRDITGRKQAEAVIREKEQRYREIFDNVSDALYLLEVTEDGRFRNIEINPALAASAGMSRDELIGKFVDETVAPEAAQAVVAKYRRCVEAGVAVEEEVELLMPSGRRTYHSTLIPVRNPSGRIHRIVGISRDITERKYNEELLRQQVALEKLLTRLVEVTPGTLGTYQLMPDGTPRVPYASPSHEEVIGLRPEELAKDASASVLLRYIHLDDVSQYLESFKESARTLSAWRSEFRLRHPVKGEVWIEARSTPERQPDGSTLWYGFMHDVTERKRAERLLRAREQEFRTLVEHLPDMIVRLDRDCRRVFVNPAYERETGIPLEQAFYSTFDEVWWPTMPRDEYKARLQQVMETGVPDQILLEMPRSDGQIASYEVNVVAEHDYHGRAVGTLAIGRNITAQRQAERELNESRTQIRELAARRERALEEERKRIAREIHDELGQLLSVLHLQAQFLQARFGAGDPLIEEKSREIMNLVGKTQQVASDIISTIRPAALSMGIVAALEWQAEELTRHTGIHCRLSGAGSDIQLDEERATAILRIVQESLTNVMRHSGASEVEVLFEQQDDCYALHIRDNGAGFDPDKTITGKSFGLVGIRERALMLGGDVAITSAPQQGALLQVRFPVQKKTGDSNHDSPTDSR